MKDEEADHLPVEFISSLWQGAPRATLPRTQDTVHYLGNTANWELSHLLAPLSGPPTERDQGRAL